MRPKKVELLIDQKLQIIRKALELGAEIDIRFHRVPSREEAKKIIGIFSKILNKPIKNHDDKWFSLERMPEIDVTAFYKLSNEEKESQLMEELERLKKGGQVNA
jgi:hypothetical protein